jgi:alcohol dehydrogenase class IV
MPTRIIFGESCIKENSNLMCIGQKALIVTGRSSKKNGSLGDVISVLKDNGIKYEIFDRVKSNPDLENVSDGADVAREAEADFIIGIGGGSSLDASKSIAVLTTNLIEPEELFTSVFKKPPLPIIAIPTTAGTGSEVTPYSILTYSKIGNKKNFYSPLIFPKTAFLDARYTIDLPYNVTIDTMLDALSHLIEGFLSVKYNDFYEYLVVNGLNGFKICYKRVLDACLDIKKLDFASRELLLYSSTLGGMLIAHTGTSMVHAMGYSLTYYKEISHGRANGMLLANYLKFNYDSDKYKIDMIMRLLGIKDIHEFDEIIKELISKEGKIPEISKDDLNKYSSIAIKAANIANNRKTVTQDDLLDIYKRSIF